MNSFYEKLIRKAEAQKEKDQKRRKRESELLEIKDERTIPKLRIKFKRRQGRKWKRR